MKAIRVVFQAAILSALLVLGSSTASLAECAGDINGDGVIDNADDAVIHEVFGAEEGDDDYIAAADLNGDGIIATADIAALQRAKQDGC